MNDKSGLFKKDTFGTCDYKKTSPDQSTLSNKTKILNIIFSFDDALKLNLAIDECIRSLNKYKRSTKQGKRTALNFAIHLDQKRISIHEAQL